VDLFCLFIDEIVERLISGLLLIPMQRLMEPLLELRVKIWVYKKITIMEVEKCLITFPKQKSE
jgi:hypothetical protein